MCLRVESNFYTSTIKWFHNIIVSKVRIETLQKEKDSKYETGTKYFSKFEVSDNLSVQILQQVSSSEIDFMWTLLTFWQHGYKTKIVYKTIDLLNKKLTSFLINCLWPAKRKFCIQKKIYREGWNNLNIKHLMTVCANFKIPYQ